MSQFTYVKRDICWKIPARQIRGRFTAVSYPMPGILWLQMPVAWGYHEITDEGIDEVFSFFRDEAEKQMNFA
jgi:hypothetical protein